jgi:hypothetical protein
LRALVTAALLKLWLGIVEVRFLFTFRGQGVLSILEANCNANPGFETVDSGGDGDITQYWFVGYDPSMKEVIVSHQGTNPDEM